LKSNPDPIEGRGSQVQILEGTLVTTTSPD